MKAILIISGFLLGLSISSFCQEKETIKKDSLLRIWLLDQCYCDAPDSCKNDDKNKYYYTGRQYISNYSMNRLIRQDITKITLDEEGLPVIGNYASMKISDDKSKVTLNTSIYNPFIKKDKFEVAPNQECIVF